MKKLLRIKWTILSVAFVVAGHSLVAEAGDYERAVLTQKLCESHGEFARNLKNEGVNKDNFKFVVDIINESKRSSASEKETMIESMWASIESSDADGAYMRAWARCMDRNSR